MAREAPSDFLLIIPGPDSLYLEGWQPFLSDEGQEVELNSTWKTDLCNSFLSVMVRGDCVYVLSFQICIIFGENCQVPWCLMLNRYKVAGRMRAQCSKNSLLMACALQCPNGKGRVFNCFIYCLLHTHTFDLRPTNRGNTLEISNCALNILAITLFFG